MNISLRPAVPDDLEFAKRICYQTMRWIIERLFGWDEAAEDAKFARQFAVDEVRIITVDGVDVGWLQLAEEHDVVFLKQLYVAQPFQACGIGTGVMMRLLDEAGRAGKAMTLAVVKINPASRFYQKLGFRITHEDEFKFYMRRDGSGATPV